MNGLLRVRHHQAGTVEGEVTEQDQGMVCVCARVRQIDKPRRNETADGGGGRTVTPGEGYPEKDDS
jgi:hypothetical protein